MTECLCPKCGFVWDNDAPPPSDELKRAVKSHLAGKHDSVYGAVMAERMPELQQRAERIQSFCSADDLARFRSGELVLLAESKIIAGHIYAWEPDKPQAAAILLVTRIQRMTNGDVRVWTIGTDNTECWNDMSRCMETFVCTSLRTLPKEPI